jgi:hypothetical protein
MSHSTPRSLTEHLKKAMQPARAQSYSQLTKQTDNTGKILFRLADGERMSVPGAIHQPTYKGRFTAPSIPGGPARPR